MATRSLLAAVSGITADQTYLDEIANNVANVNTIGYKSGTVMFGDLLAEQITGATAPTTTSGGINPVAIGSGVRVVAVNTNLAEGTIQSTGNPTDVAITGNGYLVVKDNGQQLYTRDGALTVDAKGTLTTLSGAVVQGWNVTATGKINYGAVSNLAIPTGQAIAAKTTSRITVKGNLPAWDGTGTKPQAVTQTVDAYNALGTVVPIVLTFTPTTANVWKVKATVTEKGTMKDLLPSTVKVTFDKTTGKIASFTPATAATKQSTTGYVLKLALPTGFPTGTLSIYLAPSSSPNALTQFTGGTTVTVSQNGYPSGDLATYSVSSDGVIVGKFSNGATLTLGQIALASFTNPGGLADIGNGLFQTSANSGQAQVGVAGTGIRGTLLGGELEGSNVNLGTELTDLITAQEAYTANTRAIVTTQTVMQALEQI